MTTIITNGSGTGVHTDDEERLSVSPPSHDVNATLDAERLRSELESENDTESYIESFSCDTNLRSLDPPEARHAPVFGIRRRNG